MHSYFNSWVRKVPLKHDNIWSVKRPPDVSWGWASILKVRELIRTQIKMKVGSDRDINLRYEYDYWCGDAPVIDKLQSEP